MLDNAPPEFVPLVSKLWAQQPQDRPTTLEEVLNQLTTCQNAMTTKAKVERRNNDDDDDDDDDNEDGAFNFLMLATRRESLDTLSDRVSTHGGGTSRRASAIDGQLINNGRKASMVDFDIGTSVSVSQSSKLSRGSAAIQRRKSIDVEFGAKRVTGDALFKNQKGITFDQHTTSTEQFSQRRRKSMTEEVDDGVVVERRKTRKRAKRIN
jgi:hypothetical protein